MLIIYVHLVMSSPSGWWHLVVNLEDSVAVTQNFVSANEVSKKAFVTQCEALMPRAVPTLSTPAHWCPGVYA